MSVRARWWVTIALGLDQILSWGALYYSYSLLAGPIATDLGVPRSHVAAGFSLALVVAGWVSLRAGPMLDRQGARPTLIRGAIAGAVALVALGSSRGSLSLLVAFALLGFAQAWGLYEPVFRWIVDHFTVATERSRAMLILVTFGGFASTICLPLLAHSIATWGWRPTVLGAAGLILALSLPLRVALDDRRGDPLVLAAIPPAPEAAWLAGALAIHALAATALSVQLVPHFTAAGTSLERAAWIAGLLGAAQVPGRSLLAPLRRWVGQRHTLLVLLGGQAIAVMFIGRDEWPTTAAVCLLGCLSGMMTLERAHLTVEWFGTSRFGTRGATLAASGLFARAVAPLAIELTYARLGQGSFTIIGGALGISSILGFVALRSRGLLGPQLQT